MDCQVAETTGKQQWKRSLLMSLISHISHLTGPFCATLRDGNLSDMTKPP